MYVTTTQQLCLAKMVRLWKNMTNTMFMKIPISIHPCIQNQPLLKRILVLNLDWLYALTSIIYIQPRNYWRKMLMQLFFKLPGSTNCPFLQVLYLKFIYSESYVVTVKSTVEISQNFVAFSEYMNFTAESSIK